MSPPQIIVTIFQFYDGLVYDSGFHRHRFGEYGYRHFGDNLIFRNSSSQQARAARDKE
jgi:hypothetical protein